jgi:hypothetical protein
MRRQTITLCTWQQDQKTTFGFLHLYVMWLNLNSSQRSKTRKRIEIKQGWTYGWTTNWTKGHAPKKHFQSISAICIFSWFFLSSKTCNDKQQQRPRHKDSCNVTLFDKKNERKVASHYITSHHHNNSIYSQPITWFC